MHNTKLNTNLEIQKFVIYLIFIQAIVFSNLYVNFRFIKNVNTMKRLEKYEYDMSLSPTL
jgi:hypothetical protein